MWQWWMGDGCTWGREWWLSGLWLLSWTTPGSLSRSPGWPGPRAENDWARMEHMWEWTLGYVHGGKWRVEELYFLMPYKVLLYMLCLWFYNFVTYFSYLTIAETLVKWFACGRCQKTNKKLTRLWRDFIQKEYCEAEKGTSAMGRMIWPWALEVAGPWPEQTGLE